MVDVTDRMLRVLFGYCSISFMGFMDLIESLSCNFFQARIFSGANVLCIKRSSETPHITDNTKTAKNKNTHRLVLVVLVVLVLLVHPTHFNRQDHIQTSSCEKDKTENNEREKHSN